MTPLSVFVLVDGREVLVDVTIPTKLPPDAIELRSSGAGWRWHDFDGNEWSTAGAALPGELTPRWRMRRRALKPDLEAAWEAGWKARHSQINAPLGTRIKERPKLREAYVAKALACAQTDGCWWCQNPITSDNGPGITNDEQTITMCRLCIFRLASVFRGEKLPASEVL